MAGFIAVALFVVLVITAAVAGFAAISPWLVLAWIGSVAYLAWTRPTSY